MAWRAPCSECGQQVGITTPVYETMSLFIRDEVRDAKAFYESHPRFGSDSRSCAAAGTQVPQSQMAQARSTDPNDEIPGLDGRGFRR